MKSVKSFKKPEGPKEGREQVNLHQTGHDSDETWYGSRLEETVSGEEKRSRRQRSSVQLGDTQRKIDKSTENRRTRGTIDDLTCMYTNIDSISNKLDELNVRIAELNPDVIGLTEVKYKNACYKLSAQELNILMVILLL